MVDTADFGPTGYSRTTAEQTAKLDVSLSDLLAELESINVQTANITAGIITTGVPLRYRSGIPIFIEEWELGNGQWTALSDGTDASSALSTTKFYSKGQSWKLVAGSDGDQWAAVRVALGAHIEAKMSLEWCWNFDTNCNQLLAWFYLWYNNKRLYGQLRLDRTTNKVELWDENDTWVTVLTSATLKGSTGSFSFFKLIVDMATLKYDTLYINGDEIDCSTIGMDWATWTYSQTMLIEFEVYGKVGVNGVCYVDSIAITEED